MYWSPKYWSPKLISDIMLDKFKIIIGIGEPYGKANLNLIYWSPKLTTDLMLDNYVLLYINWNNWKLMVKPI